MKRHLFVLLSILAMLTPLLTLCSSTTITATAKPQDQNGRKKQLTAAQEEALARFGPEVRSQFDDRGRLTGLSGPLSTRLHPDDPATEARKALEIHGAAFRRGPDDGFAVKGIQNDANGTTQVRLAQTYKGLKVIGGEMDVRLDADYVTGIRGAFISDVNLDIAEPSVTFNQAKATALRSVGDELKGVLLSEHSDRGTAIFVDKKRKSHQVHAVRFERSIIGGTNAVEVLVDANSGEVVGRHVGPSKRTAGVALFLHLLDRYANDAANPTDLDRAIAQGLAEKPEAKEALRNVISQWKSLPQVQREEIFGSEFASVDTNAEISSEVIERELRGLFEQSLAKVEANARTAEMVGQDDGAPANGASPAFRSEGGAELNALGFPIIPITPIVPIRPTVTRYRLDFAGLYCQQETSWDGGSDSDEPYVVFTSVTDTGGQVSARSVTYGDVDRGEARGPSPVIWLYGPSTPRQVTVMTTVMEHDFGNEETVKAAIDAAVWAGVIIANLYGIPIPIKVAEVAGGIITALLGLDDDLLGATTFTIYPGDFEWWATQGLLSFKGLTYHFTNLHTDGDVLYWVMYRMNKIVSFL